MGPLFIIPEANELSSLDSNSNDHLTITTSRYYQESNLVLSCIHICILLLLVDWTRLKLFAILIYTLFRLSRTVQEWRPVI